MPADDVAAPGVPASSVHLDAVRGAAAVAVVIFHARYLFFVDYSELASPSLATRFFYAATSFGHDAVMVFYVLSGYLITGTVLKDLAAERWSWRRYLTYRLTRLYVVLIPGLLLTVICDVLGTHMLSASETRYWGPHYRELGHALTPRVFLGNLLFRQGLPGTPMLGSNGALWSLTYEFAYYLIFPMLALACRRDARWRSRVMWATGASLIACYFGWPVALYFPIWLVGLAVRLLPAVRRAQPSTIVIRNLIAAACAAGTIAFRHSTLFVTAAGTLSLEAGDFLVGFVFGLALYVLINDSTRLMPNAYTRIAQWSSGLSYTLYVVHMPLLVLARAWLLHGEPWTASAASVSAAAFVSVAALACAWGLHYCFESRTDAVRAFLIRSFSHDRPVRAARESTEASTARPVLGSSLTE
jgi:peptidoglycan/LPS O-acetylase OafA/YrhL